MKQATTTALAMALGALTVFAQASDDPPRVRASMDRTVAVQFTGISPEQEDAYLLRLGLTTNMTINMSERHWQKTGARARELVTPWGTLTRSHGVQRVSLPGRSMEVRSTELENGVRFTDDLGGDRVQQYGMFPEAGCGPATEANLLL